MPGEFGKVSFDRFVFIGFTVVSVLRCVRLLNQDAVLVVCPPRPSSVLDTDRIPRRIVGSGYLPESDCEGRQCLLPSDGNIAISSSSCFVIWTKFHHLPERPMCLLLGCVSIDRMHLKGFLSSIFIRSHQATTQNLFPQWLRGKPDEAGLQTYPIRRVYLSRWTTPEANDSRHQYVGLN